MSRIISQARTITWKEAFYCWVLERLGRIAERVNNRRLIFQPVDDLFMRNQMRLQALLREVNRGRVDEDVLEKFKKILAEIPESECYMGIPQHADSIAGIYFKLRHMPGAKNILDVFLERVWSWMPSHDRRPRLLNPW